MKPSLLHYLNLEILELETEYAEANRPETRAKAQALDYILEAIRCSLLDTNHRRCECDTWFKQAGDETSCPECKEYSIAVRETDEDLERQFPQL